MSQQSTSYASLDLKRSRLMGIVNVTPDSFSDGGHFLDSQKAIEHGLALIEAGADILDVGGESTRPGAAPVSLDEEIRRVVPVIEQLSQHGALVSIDTRHAAVMTAAVEAGAAIINDVTDLEGDPDSLATAAKLNVPVILMHMQGEPGTMQDNPTYQDAPREVFESLIARGRACEAAGIPADKIAIDPGIGFGKNLEHNLQILQQLDIYQSGPYPVVLGTSRKSFIAKLSRGEPAPNRVAGSIATVLDGYAKGVRIFRVHDVAETRQALDVFEAIQNSKLSL